MGMCGGFAMLAHTGTRGGLRFAVYGLGKTLTYVVLGVSAGALGQALAVSPAASLVLRVLVGLIVIGSGLQLGGWVAFDRLYMPPAAGRLVGALSARVGSPSMVARFSMGALNGLLPCGLLYAALGAAAGTMSWWAGAAFMAVFGLFTLPALFVAGQLGRLLDAGQRRILVRMGAILVIVFGALMLVRGMPGMH
ncbi:MAG: hypothetical protein COV99_06145 [Bacteroidetes bacterium CG12_big_fil_rev_8_21_14_0_65_60_17]|nr:MAG: hypothetical protein COV99_06145 [Bacteroidetes bacterium CG12_big_fil_rev_8_21_14_0_65_60_17]